MKFLKKLLDKEPRIITMNTHDEQRIIGELAKIEGMENFLELHRQAGYQLYGRTKEERYLGYVNFVESIQVQIKQSRVPEEPVSVGGGYESTVEEY